MSTVLIFISEDGHKSVLVHANGKWHIDGKEAKFSEMEAIFRLASEGHGQLSGGSKTNVMNIANKDLFATWEHND